MTYDATYQLTNILHGLRLHMPSKIAYVADSDDTADLSEVYHGARNLELESQIRSGDYFSMLATRLDDLSTRLSESDILQRSEVDSLVSDFLYLDQYYHLVRKTKQ